MAIITNISNLTVTITDNTGATYPVVAGATLNLANNLIDPKSLYNQLSAGQISIASGNLINVVTPSPIISQSAVSNVGGELNNELWNVVSSNLPKWRQAKARVQDGAGNAKIFTLGDSITYGLGGTHASTSPYLDSYPRRLSSVINSRGIPSSLGFGIPQYGSPDSRWTSPSGWTIQTYGPCGQACWGASSPSNPLLFTPGVNSDTYDIYYISTGGSASVSAFSATGGTVYTGSLVGSNTIGKVTVTAASASTSNVVSMSGTGNVWILGVEPSLSTTSQILVGNMGLPGQSAATWISGGFYYSNGQSLLTKYAPDLTIISLGVNDATAGQAVSQFSTNLASLITTAQAAGDVILLTPPPQSSGTVNPLLQQYVQSAYYPLASQFGVPLVDWFNRFNGVNNSNFMGAIHPNNVGYWDASTWFAEGILSV